MFLDNPLSATLSYDNVLPPRRSGHSHLALETLVPHARAYRRSFADEVAIDFPSSSAAIEFFRRDQIDAGDAAGSAVAEIAISACQAGTGAMVPLEVSVTCTCPRCGGRGEVWSDRCEPCDGRGQEVRRQRLTVSVPAGVVHGDRFSFTVSPPRGPRTRVDVRVAVTPP